MPMPDFIRAVTHACVPFPSLASIVCMKISYNKEKYIVYIYEQIGEIGCRKYMSSYFFHCRLAPAAAAIFEKKHGQHVVGGKNGKQKRRQNVSIFASLSVYI